MYVTIFEVILQILILENVRAPKQRLSITHN